MIGKILSVVACTALALPALAQQFTSTKSGNFGARATGATPGFSQFTTYQPNRYFSAEIGMRQFADTYLNERRSLFNGLQMDRNVTVEETTLSLQARYPVTGKLDAYGRASLRHIDYETDAGKRSKVNEAEAGVGAVYSVTPKVDVRVEALRVKSRPANVSVGAGLSF